MVLASVLWLSLCAIVLAAPLAADETADPLMEQYLDLPLEDLLSLDVSSVSKRTQRVSQAAAAVSVITNDDLRRSGVSTIPEALRMVPGLQVARIDANKWAISSRGFNGRFSNKLLVLMDGRSVYSPSFSGVYWDVQDTLLADIERIEIIRGPGATLWGANAVNGVINIITKSSADTQGALVSLGAGNEERAFAGFRYGGSLAEAGDYRLYAKYFDRDGNQDAITGEETADDWTSFRAGFRADLLLSDEDDLTLQGDYYSGQSGERVVDYLLVPPYQVQADYDTEVSGFNIMGRWDRWLSDTDDMSLQAYFDRTERDWSRIGEDRNTLDLDFHYRSRRWHGHDLLAGLGYRYTGDSFRNTEQLLMLADEHDDHLFSAFIQDDIELSPDRWVLTLGSKFEHNDYTGFEVQPNLRLMWTPNERQTLWASIARAVRTPVRLDYYGSVRTSNYAPGTADNPSPVPLEHRVQGNGAVRSETVIAYEAGFKWQAARSLSLDTALFYNDYERLLSSQQDPTLCLPTGTPPECFFTSPTPTSLLVSLKFGDRAKGEAYGFELAADWQVVKKWQLKAAYSYLDQTNHDGPGYIAFATYNEGSNHAHQASLRSLFNPSHNIDLDLWLRYTDALDGSFGGVPQKIDAYWQLDVRAAWRPAPELELSLVGQNLLDAAHPEFLSEMRDIPLISIERAVYGQLRWRF